MYEVLSDTIVKWWRSHTKGILESREGHFVEGNQKTWHLVIKNQNIDGWNEISHKVNNLTTARREILRMVQRLSFSFEWEKVSGNLTY